VDEGRALQALTEILARPELNPAPPAFDPWGIFWSAVWRLVLDILTWLFSPVGRVLSGQADLLQVLAVVGALLVVIAGAWFVVRAVRGGMVADGVALARAQALRRERADRLWREAHDLAAAGKLSDAVRALYLSALYALEEHDVRAVQEALTNREHAERLARSRPGASGAFAEVVQRYDRLRYGGYAVDRPAFDELSALVERARALDGLGPLPAPVVSAA
jgi:hypothetical protein